MKYFLILIGILFWTSADAQESPVYLSVQSIPPGVQIRLDNVFIGVTPLQRIAIQPGKYSIEALTPEAGIWNMKNVTHEVEIKAGHDTTVTISFPSMVMINSIPFHAQLILDNQIIGTTPLFVDLDLYRGKEFSLEKSGYKSIRFTIHEGHSQLFTLQPLDLSALGEDQDSFGSYLFNSSRRTKFIFLTGTVVTHWMSFYFKNVADDSYEKYLQTGNPALMKKYWDESQKYDRLSDITLGISYAFLGGLIYNVLWH